MGAERTCEHHTVLRLRMASLFRNRQGRPMHSDYIFKPSRPVRRAFMTQQSTSYMWTTALMKWPSLSLSCALVFAASGQGPQVSTRVVRAYGLEHAFTGKGIEHADCNTGGGHRCITEPWQLTAGMHASVPYICLYIQSMAADKGTTKCNARVYTAPTDRSCTVY